MARGSSARASRAAVAKQAHKLSSQKQELQRHNLAPGLVLGRLLWRVVCKLHNNTFRCLLMVGCLLYHLHRQTNSKDGAKVGWEERAGAGAKGVGGG